MHDLVLSLNKRDGLLRHHGMCAAVSVANNFLLLCTVKEGWGISHLSCANNKGLGAIAFVEHRI